LDEGFIKRVYRTSVFVWIFLLVWCAALRSAAGAIGITVGLGLSLGSLMHIERLVKALFTPDNISQAGRRPVRKLIAIGFVKYAIIGAVLWGVLRSGWASPVGLAIGIGLPYLVILLKALGSAISFGSELSRRS
jgi:hypothetical protein